jgi:2-dehydro-3-deoxyphosphooctonate aldolase (KDO 8-P synthase)
MTEPFKIQNVEVGNGKLFFLLGPCALESEDFAWSMARSVHEIATRLGIPFLFKASYDKANRTSGTSFRGPGVQEGCRILAAIGKDLGVPVTTDVHTAQEAEITNTTKEIVTVKYL